MLVHKPQRRESSCVCSALRKATLQVPDKVKQLAKVPFQLSGSGKRLQARSQRPSPSALFFPAAHSSSPASLPLPFKLHLAICTCSDDHLSELCFPS